MTEMPHPLEDSKWNRGTPSAVSSTFVLLCVALLGIDALAFQLTLDEDLDLQCLRVDGPVLVDVEVHQRLKAREVLVLYPSVAAAVAVEGVVALRDLATNREAA